MTSPAEKSSWLPSPRTTLERYPPDQRHVGQLAEFRAGELLEVLEPLFRADAEGDLGDTPFSCAVRLKIRPCASAG